MSKMKAAPPFLIALLILAIWYYGEGVALAAWIAVQVIAVIAPTVALLFRVTLGAIFLMLFFVLIGEYSSSRARGLNKHLLVSQIISAILASFLLLASSASILSSDYWYGEDGWLFVDDEGEESALWTDVPAAEEETTR